MKILQKRLRARRALAATLVALAVLVSVLSTPGAAEPGSTAAASMETTFVFDQPIGLSRVADALREAGVVPVRFTHTGPDGEGGNHSRGLSFEEAVAQYQADYSLITTGEPQISSLTVDGSVSTDRLTTLAGSVVERYVDTTHVAVPEPEVVRLQEPPEPPKLFAPEFGRTLTSNRPRSREPVPDRRMIVQELTWATRESINDIGENNVYEHDFKLVNRNNIGFGPMCAPGQADNFWAQARSTTFDTNFPQEVGPYLDTGALDDCDFVDFTIGLYHPNRLAPNIMYRTTIVTDAGENDSSPYFLTGQKLVRQCDADTPACIGLNPFNPRQDRQLLIGEERSRAPECRSWRKGQESRPCA